MPTIVATSGAMSSTAARVVMTPSMAVLVVIVLPLWIALAMPIVLRRSTYWRCIHIEELIRHVRVGWRLSWSLIVATSVLMLLILVRLLLIAL